VPQVSTKYMIACLEPSPPTRGFLVTQQQLCDRAGVVDKHIPSAFMPAASQLVSWSAFNAGMAKMGVGLVTKLATRSGWDELQAVLGLDNYDATEAGALSLTAAAVTTSIDLAAAAALRLAGAVPPSGDWEFSMTTFTSNKKLLAAHPLTPALGTWATAVSGSPERDLLKKCRNQAVHRTASRIVYGTTRAAPLPSSEVNINGTHHPIDVLVKRFSDFGETTFGKFCDAVLTDFSKQVR
jgi:hypothetical protein